MVLWRQFAAVNVTNNDMIHEIALFASFADSTLFLVLTAVFQLHERVGLPFLGAIVSELTNVTTPGTDTTIGPLDLSPAVSALNLSP